MKMKKRILLTTMAVVTLIGFTGCGTKKTESKSDDKTELTVFAAASMTETLDEIATLYKDVNPDVTITYTYDSSGTLKTQIEEGADCDIFISAAQKQMNELEDEYILKDSRFDLVENKVVLAVPEGNPAGINSYEDLKTDKLSLICLGNDDVPVGAYSVDILTNLGILDTLESGHKITYGSNVKEVTTQILEASVDCGIIYATDAFSANLTVVDEATKDMCGQVIYPAAVLKNSKNIKAAEEFLDYLKSDDATKVFESVGFKMAGNE